MSKEHTLVWMAQRTSLVESHGTTTLRIKQPSKMGKNLMDFADIPGEMIGIELSVLLHLKPVIIEIIGSRNPLEQLLNKLDAAPPKDEIVELFHSVRVVIIHEASCSAETICRFLSRLKILTSISFAGVDYTESEWDNITKALLPLNVRCLSAGCGPVSAMARALNVEILHLSGQPGIRLSELVNRSDQPLVTVRTLFAQEVDFESAGETAAQQLLQLIPDHFPRLESLVFDWNMVDPLLTMDAQTKGIIGAINELKSRVPLTMIAIIAYTPCGETKFAAGEIARLLSSTFHQVSLVTFATRGVPEDKHNFSLVLGGESVDSRSAISELMVQRRTSIVSSAHSPLLIDAESSLHNKGVLVDFGGFDAASIRAQFNNQGDIQIAQ